MSLLHPGLLYGLLLAGIPVLLHFLMRSRPKRYDFPALRLLAAIRKQNVQRMRLRHVGLLLLRIFLLVALVLAITRPTLPAANYGLAGREWAGLLGTLAVVVGGYLLARRFWVARAVHNAEQKLRHSYVQAGSWVGLVVLLLLLVGWPYQMRLQGEIKNPGDQRQLNIPVAAVFLFDVSASMGYRHENQTRIEQAYELAMQQTEGFPRGSRVAIADNLNSKPIGFVNNLNGAQTRLKRAESQQPQAATLPFNDRLLAAISLQRDHRQELLAESDQNDAADRYLREVYIYTDRTRAAWSVDTADRLRTELEQVPWLRCYVIDVGVEPGTNYTLRNLELSSQNVVPGSLVRVTASIDNQSTSPLNDVVELYLDDAAGEAVKRDQQTISLEPAESGQVSFTFAADRLGAIQGELVIAATDPLEVDNRLPFTVQANVRPQILIVSETDSEAFIWSQALAPAGLVERGVHRYDVDTVRPPELTARLSPAGNTSVVQPEVVYLVNVERLSPSIWESLRGFVDNGGGLGIIWGAYQIDVQSYRDAELSNWLPALPTLRARANPLTQLSITRPDHPVFEYLDQIDALAFLASSTVRRYWKSELMDDADVLARFEDAEQTPAVVAGRLGRGRIVTVSTAVDLEGAADQKNWSDLPRQGWVFTAWADQMTRFLQPAQTRSLNRVAGSTMLLTLPDPWYEMEVLLQRPGLRQNRLTIPYRGDGLTISAGEPDENAAGNRPDYAAEKIPIDQLGSYRLVFPENRLPSRGFSLHLADSETNLQRLSNAELDELFGVDRWQLSRSYEELERTVLLGRIGQEAYPLLITLLLVFFVGEHLVANFFYGRPESMA